MSGRTKGSSPLLLHPFACLIVFVIFYLSIILHFTDYMRRKPVAEKLGVLPRVEVLQFASADHKQFFAASMVMKVMMYFGGLMEDGPGKYKIPPDYQTMSRMIHGSVKLDPYNMDAYYFSQALFVWDVGAYKMATDLLSYGMKFRTWDWYLPFFAGFNSAYFLKDYENAAKYYQKAADLSGEPLFATLAGRYMQKSGQTELALIYLTTMAKSAKNEAIKRSYAIRLNALQVVRTIEIARDSYKLKNGRLPTSVEQLLKEGYLVKAPVDPYGGTFYFEPDGNVLTTSEFTFAAKKK